MTNNFTKILQKSVFAAATYISFRHKPRAAQLEFSGKFTSAACAPCEHGNFHLSNNKPRKAKSIFESALGAVERELQNDNGENKNALLLLKGEALLGLGKVQVALKKGIASAKSTKKPARSSLAPSKLSIQPAT
jgi:hypothetical protein